MKRITLLSLLTIMTIALYSQYLPLVEEGKEWSTLTEIFHFPWDPATYTTEIIKIDGDTIINSVTYSKLYSSPEEIPTNWYLSNFIREDSDKKVWFRDLNGDTDYLMYDFSVNVGDSVPIGYFDPVYLHVNSIVPIEVNGTVRKHYTLSCTGSPEYEETWIEGLGSDKGLLYSGGVYFTGGWTYLLCVHEDAALAYINPEYNVCYFLNVGISEEKVESIQFYPNPAKNKVLVSNPGEIEFEVVSLIDMSGRTVIDFYTESNCYDISKVNPGIYFLKVIFRDGQICRKIVIE